MDDEGGRMGEARKKALTVFMGLIDCSLTFPVSCLNYLRIMTKFTMLSPLFNEFMLLGEVYVVVEFCALGNLQNYLRAHRDKFQNQLQRDILLVEAPYRLVWSKNLIK